MLDQLLGIADGDVSAKWSPGHDQLYCEFELHPRKVICFVNCHLRNISPTPTLSYTATVFLGAQFFMGGLLNLIKVMCFCSPGAHGLQSELRTQHLVKEKGQFAPGH